MPLDKTAQKELDSALSMARKVDLPFGLCLGKKPDKTVLLTHRSRDPELLGKKARQDGETALFTFGTMTVKGSKVSLSLKGKTPPGLIKKTRQFLKEGGQIMKVLIVQADGTVLEEETDGASEDETPDSEEETPEIGQESEAVSEEETEEEEAPETEEIDEELAGWLKDRIRILVPEVKKFASVNPMGGPRVVEALKGAQKLLSKNQLSRAQETIVKLEKLLKVTPLPQAPAMPDSTPPESVPPEPPVDNEEARRKLQQAFQQLSPDLAQFLKRAAPSLSGKAKQIAKAFREEVTGNDLKKAVTLLSALKKFIEANLGNLPPLSKADQAKEAIASATGPAPVERYEQAAGIMGKYPKAATAAREAMDQFAAVLGDQPATQDLINQARADIETAKSVLEAANERLKQAQALPDSEAKQKAIEAAQGDVNAAQGKLDGCKAFEEAAVAKKALTEALAFGPLSANSGKAFSDEAATALIQGFTRDPGLSQAALEAATTGQFPDAVAMNLAAMIDRKENGFKADNDRSFADPEFSDKYAKDLLKMGANSGPEFFERMSDYIASGRQFEIDPIQENGITDPAARAQIRSVAVGGALLDSEGHIDTGSQAAKNAIGDLLFSPFSLENPTPALNKHVLDTLKTFDDPTTGPKANAILDKIPDDPPQNSKTLVRKALRKGGTDAVGKDDVQKAVLASMLKPLDQGPVGSCFSTAPCRRMRETDPISAMEAYASIAGTGKYKPKNGPEVPIVTRIPPNEDPIMRSWEYSMATSTARTAKSSESENVKALTNNALNGLGDTLTEHLADEAKGGGGLIGWGKEKVEKLLAKGRLKELKKKVSEEADLVYDPNSTITNSSDGKSSTGRYVLRRKDNGNDITTADQFGDYVADQAIAAYGIDPTSTLANDLRTLCKRADVLGAMKNGDTAPWAMSSGGQTEAATKTLFGKGLKQREITEEGSTSDDTADRNKKILEDLMESFEGSTDEMVTIRTVGMHGFNALPNDPSLEPLKRGGKSKLAENIQRELVDKAQSLHDTTYDADKTGYLYDRIAAAVVEAVPDWAGQVRTKLQEALTTRRPTTGKKPGEMNDLVAAAVHDTRPHYPNGKEDVWENLLKGAAKGKVQTEVIQDAGASEFVIADSNWGDSTSHTFFVIAPDPISGEMGMFEKTVPPGSLRPSDRSWTDAEWAKIS